MIPRSPDGLVVRTCEGSVAQVVERLRAETQRRGITVFAVIDHAQGARDAGLQLADEVVVIMGNPSAGTALMQQDPRAGIELPLRVLVWDEHGQTRLAYAPPTDLSRRFALGSANAAAERLTGVLESIADAVARVGA